VLSVLAFEIPKEIAVCCWDAGKASLIKPLLDWGKCSVRTWVLELGLRIGASYGYPWLGAVDEDCGVWVSCDLVAKRSWRATLDNLPRLADSARMSSEEILRGEDKSLKTAPPGRWGEPFK
jgi:hypothetical protein